MPKITINNQLVNVKKGTSILNAAKSIGVEIPTLCFIKEINEIGFCRICVVEVEGEQDLISACNTEVTNGMVIYTDSDKVLNSRTTSLQLLASKHRFDCWRCPKDGMCEFYDLLKAYDVVFDKFGPGIGRNLDIIPGAAVNQDQSKCVLCKRCVAVCNEVVTAKVLKFRDDDGINPIVSPTPGLSFDESGCIYCGSCVKSCPTGTLFETNYTEEVERLLRTKDKTVIVQVSPTVGKAVAETFDHMPEGHTEDLQDELFEALDLLGFDEVTNTNWAKEITIMETSNELVNRLENDGVLPLITSLSPAWDRYTELYYPEYIDNLSQVKSPHMIHGALLKGFLAPKYLDKAPEDVAVVTVSGSTSRKYEITREELHVNGLPNVDAVLSIHDLSKLIKRKGIDYKHLKGKKQESKLPLFKSEVLNEYQGGVLETTLQLVAKKLSDQPLGALKYKVTFGDQTDSHGLIKEATVAIAGKKLNVAIVSGGVAIKEFYTRLQTDKKQYHFVEFATDLDLYLSTSENALKRELPVHKIIRRSTDALTASIEMDSDVEKDTQALQVIYDQYLEAVNSETAKEYLHTHYSKKEFRKE